jgi:hypothetical protein
MRNKACILTFLGVVVPPAPPPRALSQRILQRGRHVCFQSPITDPPSENSTNQEGTMVQKKKKKKAPAPKKTVRPSATEKRRLEAEKVVNDARRAAEDQQTADILMTLGREGIQPEDLPRWIVEEEARRRLSVQPGQHNSQVDEDEDNEGGYNRNAYERRQQFEEQLALERAAACRRDKEATRKADAAREADAAHEIDTARRHAEADAARYREEAAARDAARRRQENEAHEAAH